MPAQRKASAPRFSDRTTVRYQVTEAFPPRGKQRDATAYSGTPGPLHAGGLHFVASRTDFQVRVCPQPPQGAPSGCLGAFAQQQQQLHQGAGVPFEIAGLPLGPHSSGGLWRDPGKQHRFN